MVFPHIQVAAFGQDMKKIGLTDQRIVTIGKQLIRSRIIQTQAIFAQGSGKAKKEWTADQEVQLRKLAKRKRSSTGFSDDELVGTPEPYKAAC